MGRVDEMRLMRERNFAERAARLKSESAQNHRENTPNIGESRTADAKIAEREQTVSAKIALAPLPDAKIASAKIATDANLALLPFAERLHRLGLSQSEFAILIDTPKRTVADWSRGATRIHGIALRMLLLLERSGDAMQILQSQRTPQN